METRAYVRVSSKAQDHQMQRHAIERAAAARGDTIGSWHTEKRTGKTLARPVLDKLRADVRAGAVPRLYVYRLDRLTRSGIRDTLDVVDELRVGGCELITVSDGFDLNGPAAEIVLAVMAWAAQMERLAINERISAARERLEAEGRPWGRPPRLQGASLDRAAKMQAAGKSVRAIASALKVPKSSVARALARPAA